MVFALVKSRSALYEAFITISLGDIYVGVGSYADDIWFLAASLADAQAMLDAAVEFASMWQFKFSPTKCKVMHYLPKAPKNRPIYVDTSLTLTMMGTPLEVVDSFLHLGILHGNSFGWDAAALRQIHAAYGKAMTLIGRGMHHGALSTESALIVLKAYIDSVADYGGQIIQPSSTAARRIDTLMNRLHRIILGVNRSSNGAAVAADLGRMSRAGRRDYLKLTQFERMWSLPHDDLVRRVLVQRIHDNADYTKVRRYVLGAPTQRSFVVLVRSILNDLHQGHRFMYHSLGRAPFFTVDIDVIPPRDVDWRTYVRNLILRRDAAGLDPSQHQSHSLPLLWYSLRDPSFIRLEYYTSYEDPFTRALIGDLRFGTSELYEHQLAVRSRYPPDGKSYSTCPICCRSVSESVVHFLLECGPLRATQRAMWNDAASIPGNHVAAWVEQAYNGGNPLDGDRVHLARLLLGGSYPNSSPSFNYVSRRDLPDQLHTVQRALWGHLKTLFYKRQELFAALQSTPALIDSLYTALN